MKEMVSNVLLEFPVIMMCCWHAYFKYVYFIEIYVCKQHKNKSNVASCWIIPASIFKYLKQCTVPYSNGSASHQIHSAHSIIITTPKRYRRCLRQHRFNSQFDTARHWPICSPTSQFLPSQLVGEGSEGRWWSVVSSFGGMVHKRSLTSPPDHPSFIGEAYLGNCVSVGKYLLIIDVCAGRRQTTWRRSSGVAGRLEHSHCLSSDTSPTVQCRKWTRFRLG